MPDFAYTARDLSGKKLTGVIAANSERDAVMQLGAKSLFPLQVTASKGARTKSTRRVPGQAMSVFYIQLASLLKSGVPMLRALTVLSQQSKNKTLTHVINEVKSRVEDGESLGDAMARFPKVFSDIAVNMVRAGSEGGFLEDSLERIGGFIEQQEDLKGKTIGALAYPGFIMCVGTVVVVVLLVFFVPKFEPLFARMRDNGKLPAATDMLLGVSSFLQAYWWVIAGVITLVLVGVRQFLETERGELVRDLVKIKSPLLGNIFLNLAVARFCRVLGTLLSNGVPILRSLEISRHAAGNKILSDAVVQASEDVTAGEKLARPLAASGHFPQTVVEMLAVAEESNTLDKVLVQISDGLEKTTFRRLEIAVRLLEPLMLLILAGIVMFVVIALMVPVLNSTSAL